MQQIVQVVFDQKDMDVLIQKIDKIALLSTPKEETEEVMSSTECMKYLKIGRTTLCKLMDEEGLPYHKPGKLVFLKSEVLQWLKTK